MSRPSKYSGIVVNLLIAVAISLVVNFSYVLLLVVEKSDDRHPPFSRELRTDREIVRVEGDVWISPDGHGYLLYVSPERLSDGDAAATGLAEVAPARDSVYIPRNSARFLRLRSGDHLLADALESHRSGGRLVLGQVLERNGEPFDYGVIFERPQEGVIFALQLFYFFVLAFLLLSLLRLGDRVRPMSGFLKRGLLCAGLAVGLYFIAPVVRWRTHELTILALSGSWLDYNLIMKCSFTLVVVLLYGQISLLLRQRQAMEVENEQLKSENLTTRYNMLVSQINPHFFFNSLNSLAMLVREGDEQKALTYIDQLSFSFRYIIRNGQNMLTTLAEELQFRRSLRLSVQDTLCRQALFRCRRRPEILGLPAARADVAGVAVECRQAQRHYQTPSAACFDPRRKRPAGRVESPLAEARRRTLYGNRPAQPRQPLAAHHGPRHPHRPQRGDLLGLHVASETPHEMKAVIIEDETAAAVNLQSILHRVAPAVEITAVLEGVEESVEWFGTHPQPDLVLMDIHLADGEAFRIFERVSLTAPVIFTTAYDRYALEAFKVDSIDYLLKPIKEEEVRRALEKLRRLSGLERSRYSERVERLAERANERQQVFLVRVRDKFIPLQRERIAYCYTSDERVTACTLDGEKYPLDKPLETLQTLLPASDFFRANRQFIVARQAVAEIAVWFGSRLALRLSVETPERIVISKARVPEFKRWLTSVHPAD